MCNTRWFEILSLYFSDLNILPHFPSSSWFLNKYDMANIHNHILLILRSRMRNRVTGRLVDLHPCKFCYYKGDCSSNLKEHVLRKHEAVSGKSRPFICPECDLKFKPKRDLKQHERRCRETKQPLQQLTRPMLQLTRPLLQLTRLRRGKLNRPLQQLTWPLLQLTRPRRKETEQAPAAADHLEAADQAPAAVKEVPDQAQVNFQNPVWKEVSWFRCWNALCLFCLHVMADKFWLDLRFFDKIRYRASFKKWPAL